MSTPIDMATAIESVVPGAKAKFDAPPGTVVALSNRDIGADLTRAQRYYEAEFGLYYRALNDLAWMQRYLRELPIR